MQFVLVLKMVKCVNIYKLMLRISRLSLNDLAISFIHIFYYFYLHALK